MYCKLNIVTYHPDVQPVRQGQRKKKGKKAKVKLIQIVCLPAGSSAVVQETDKLDKSWNDVLLVKNWLLKSEDSGTAPLMPVYLQKGTYLRKAATVDLIRTDADENNINTEESEEKFSVLNYQTHSNECLCWRKQELRNQLQSVSTSLSVSAEEMKQLYDILGEFHDIFSLDDDKRGETSLVEFNRDTGDSPPIKQAYAVQHKIATQLSKMQDGGVIQP